jgi:hypothetical protein
MRTIRNKSLENDGAAMRRLVEYFFRAPAAFGWRWSCSHPAHRIETQQIILRFQKRFPV